jgi:tetratricopeptide (TPR) repeat protein
MIKSVFVLMLGMVFLVLASVCNAAETWLNLVKQAQEHSQARDYPAALKLANQALEMVQQSSNALNDRLAFNYLVIGQIYQRQGLPRNSEPYFREAYSIGLKLKSVGVPVNFSMEETCISFGVALRENQKLEEALNLLRSCSNPNQDVTTGEGFEMAVTTINALHQKEQFEEAERMANDVLAQLRAKKTGDSLNEAIMMHLLAKSIQPQRFGKRWSEVSPLLRNSLAMCQKVPDSDPLVCANIELGQANFLGSQRRFEEATQAARHSYDVRLKELGETNPYTATSALLLGKLYFFQGQYQEALPILRYVHTTFKRVYGSQNDYINNAQDLLVKCLHELGKDAEARQLQKETGVWVVK